MIRAKDCEQFRVRRTVHLELRDDDGTHGEDIRKAGYDGRLKVEMADGEILSGVVTEATVSGVEDGITLFLTVEELL